MHHNSRLRNIGTTPAVYEETFEEDSLPPSLASFILEQKTTRRQTTSLRSVYNVILLYFTSAAVNNPHKSSQLLPGRQYETVAGFDGR